MVEFVLHYGELALKRKNRPYFEKTLIRNIRDSLKAFPIVNIKKLSGRYLIVFSDDVNVEKALSRLVKVIGISYVFPVCSTPPDIDLLKQAIGEKIKTQSFQSFGVRASRGEKEFPYTSIDIERIVGSHIQGLTGARVDLDNPELPVYIEVLNHRIFFYFQKFRGTGGLPVGASARVASLVSGGIDSPVSTYLMMRRGCSVVLIHFHSAPFTSTESQDKIIKLAEILNAYQPSITIYMVPFADVQKEIVTSVPSPYRVILYRRFMLRISEVLARKAGAKALVTGDSLGQVASQTLENLNSISKAASDIPILRPLIGMDKEDIIRWAKIIETYECSILPHSDCCTFLMPQSPLTHSEPEEVDKVEANLDIQGLIKRALEKVEIRKVASF